MKPNAASERSGISECDEGARKQTLSEPSPNSSCTINALERPSFRLLPPVFTSSSQRFRLAVFSAGNEVRNPVRRQSAPCLRGAPFPTCLLSATSIPHDRSQENQRRNPRFHSQEPQQGLGQPPCYDLGRCLTISTDRHIRRKQRSAMDRTMGRGDSQLRNGSICVVDACQ
jgi:hypothetical protein